MKTVRKVYLLLVGISWIAVSGCADPSFFDQNQKIPKKSWKYDFKPTFKVNITDIDSRYAVYVNVRHTNDYTYSNLFILLNEIAPDGAKKTYRVEVKLAEQDGRWIGKGAGSVFSRQVLVLKEYTYPQKGQYTYAVEQNMRESPLMEITDIGIAVQPIQR